MERPSCADTLREKLEHALVAPFATPNSAADQKENVIESELIMAMTNMGKVRPTMATPGKSSQIGTLVALWGFLFLTRYQR